MDELRVASGSVSRPLMIYDGDCPFCVRTVDRFRALTAGTVEYVAAEQAAARCPGIPPERLARAVQLVTLSGRVVGGAEAVLTALASAGKRWPLRLYQSVPCFAWVAERAYGLVARHRRRVPVARR